MNTPNYYDELVVFLGASYFRAVGQKLNYGLSARGLAVDTALSSGEEFPDFKTFWLIKPKPSDKSIIIYALLDSPSVAGAYSFEILPGIATTMEIQAHLHPRKTIKKLGLAPLTSMYFYGENTMTKPIDYRPEVHDSDGVMIHTSSGEWIWRPLQNDRNLLVNSFSLLNPRGFGLIQRDRNFDHYQDLETHYENRPSTWVTPRGEWGEGRVELIQIPTRSEYNDNIVAFWVPKHTPKAGDNLRFSYALSWFREDPKRHSGGYVTATRVMPGRVPDSYKFVLDFNGGQLSSLSADAGVEAVIDIDNNGKLLEHQIQKNEITQGWRVVFQAQRHQEKPMEIRVSLKRDNDFLTETWSYVVVR